jgi:hypothetical protein
LFWPRIWPAFYPIHPSADLFDSEQELGGLQPLSF